MKKDLSVEEKYVEHVCLVLSVGVADTSAFVEGFARSKRSKSQRSISVTTSNELGRTGR